MDFNVSVEKIQEGISYFQEEFTNPLVKVGEQLIDQYTDLNKVLQSEAIDRIIKDQQTKLGELQAELKRISEKAQSTMDDSSREITENQANIDETLANM